MTIRRPSPLVLAALWLLGAACSKPSDTTDAKRSPRPPPVRVASAAAQAALHVEVEIDGAPAPPIDASRLAGHAPDFSDDERRTWRIASLVGPAAARPGAVVVATGEKGLSLEMPAPKGAADPVPALSLNRRGDVVVGLVDPAEPFPEYHGRGGRLSRPGDPLPRLTGVTRLRIFVQGR